MSGNILSDFLSECYLQSTPTGLGGREGRRGERGASWGKDEMKVTDNSDFDIVKI